MDDVTIQDRTAPASRLSPQEVGEGLSVISIAKSYDKRVVLSDVSLTVGKGEVVGLLGPNGAGKTTCFSMILGLVPIDAGRVKVIILPPKKEAEGADRKGDGKPAPPLELKPDPGKG